MGKDLNELASYMEPLAQMLINRCAAAGVPVRVVDTGRTPIQQMQNVTKGVSWTQNSKHLPQPPEMKSEAIDVVPMAILAENKPDWDPKNPLWLKIGLIGEAIGLVWGGRWQTHPDPSHFQCVHPTTVTTT